MSRYTYHLDGTRVLSEEYGSKLILYIYDEVGSIIGMAYRESSYASGVFDYYLFTKNLQGDIIGIYNTSGSCVASYTYNAWGECTVANNTSAKIGNINPFRYRGYYYDTETGFYYLNARYYDPQIKRFINADEIGYLGANGDLNSYNLYAYCSNNPVMYVDPTGNSLAAVANAFWTFWGYAVSDGPSIVGDLVGIFFLASAVIDAIWNDSTDTIEKEESPSIAETVINGLDDKVYYGAQIIANQLVINTEAMNFFEARSWVELTAELGRFGRKASWGVYTKSQMDAKVLAQSFSFGPLKIDTKTNEFPHYHTSNSYLDIGKGYKHFHFWFGEINK